MPDITPGDTAAIEAWAETLRPLFEGMEIRPQLANAMRRVARERAEAERSAA